jgi:glycosyltransferase involved in cell wall biosynthesis
MQKKKLLIIASQLNLNTSSGSLCNIGIIKALEPYFDIALITEYGSINDFGFEGRWLTASKPVGATLAFWKWKIVRFSIAKLGIWPIGWLKKRSLAHKVNQEVNANHVDVALALGSGGLFYPHDILASLKGAFKKWAFIHDPFPSFVFPEPYQIRVKGNNREFRKLNSALQKIDVLWFPSQLLADHMQPYYGYPDSKVFVFPHPIFEQPLPSIENLPDWLPSSPFYLHTGNLLKARRVDNIVRGFEKLKADKQLDQHLKLVFIGPVAYETDAFQSDHVLFIKERIPYHMTHAISAKAKALMIVEHEGASSPFLPGKVPQYLTLQKPVMHFGPKVSEVNRILNMIGLAERGSAQLENLQQIENVLKHGGVSLNHPVIQEYWDIQRVKSTIDSSIS